MSLPSRRHIIATALALGAGAAWPSLALADDRPTQPVEDFYNALLDAMRHARILKVKGRYQALEPVMLKSFDVEAMTRLAIGHTFDSLAPDDQERLRAAMGRLLVASFASEFDDFKGERFTIDDQVGDQDGGKLVRTKFHPTGAPVDINYLVRKSGDQWRVVDIYLNGSISQIATWRSKFGSLLRSGGPQAMLQAVQQQTDRYLATI